MIKDIITAQQIHQKIQSAENILLITHQNPDGDGLGAMSALSLYLEKLNKNFRLFCLHPVPDHYLFLPNLHLLTTDARIFFEKVFDLIIVLDSSNLEYAGVKFIIDQLRYNYLLVNIDHHLTNDGFGQLNLVQSQSSSASEVVYDLLRLWQAPITKEMATALLNGIIFDTGIFSNDGTTLSSLSVSSHLLNLGARHQEINQNTLRNKSLELLKLWGRAFERLTYNPVYDLAFTVLILKDFEELGIEPGSIDGLSNFFNELSGAGVIMVLLEKPDGTIKGSLRTTNNNVNLAKLAHLWNGGGHRKASGFSLKGRLVYNNGNWLIK
jgi:bifunctional oligoribonuclease and PAP phosphatase NrnA